MITILSSWLLVFIYATKLKVIRRPAFLVVFFVTCFLALLSYAEVILLSPQDIFSRLDESYFRDVAGLEFNELLAEGSRYRVFHVYNFLTYNSLFGWDWALKIHLVAFSLLIMLVLYDSIRSIYVIWFFPIVFSYVIFLSTLNMRDVVLIFVTLFSLLYLSRSENLFKKAIWSIVPILFLFYIRPQAAYFYFFVSFWIIFFATQRRSIFFSYYLPSALVLSLIIFYLLFGQLIVNIQIYTPYNLEFYLHDRSEELQRIPFLGENMTALIRQIITPLPSSKVGQILVGDMSINFYFYEMSRSVMMLAVYALIAYLIFSWRFLSVAFRQNSFLGVLLILAAMYTVAYAIYSDGGGDSRNKLYPFFLFYLLFFEIIREKRACLKRNLVVPPENNRGDKWK